MSPIKVLIVDDSLFMRTVLKDMISTDNRLVVVGSARNGKEALNLIPKLKPHVITLDIEMPVMDGISTLKQIMDNNPLPVIMLSTLTKDGAALTLEALDLGAVDYIPKPTGTTKIGEVKDTLIAKIKEVSVTPMHPLTRRKRVVKRKPRIISLAHSNKIVAIGASTGGPNALTEVLSNLPKEMPPTMIVQHMPKPFTKYFAERLNRVTKFEVREAQEGDRLEPGLALLAPGDWHMVVTKQERVHLHKGAPIFTLRPTVDEMMVSAAEIYGKRTLGVILTGMGSDGTLGMKAIKKTGGLNIAQNQETCVVFGMPKAAIAAGVIDSVVSLDEIPDEIVKRCK
jgi:two-component system, chemotaxis family, protein-glutamate methylesterase/glutaminase